MYYPTKKRKVSMDQLVYISSLAHNIKESYNKLTADIANDLRHLLMHAEPLLPSVHKAEDSPMQWLVNLEQDIQMKSKSIASFKVSEDEEEHISLSEALDSLIELVDDHVTVFRDYSDENEDEQV